MKLPQLYKTIGEHRHYNNCRFCFSSSLVPVLDLGNVPLAGGFLKSKKDFTKEKLYPLSLAFCKNCFLLQTREVIPADILFKNYFYHSSAIKTLVNHFKSTVKELKKEFKNQKNKLVIEIGCNDGTFIEGCIKQGFRAVGIDPADNIVKPLIKKGLPILNEYFTTRTSAYIIKNHGKVDIIFSSNTLAHIENMHGVFEGIKILLKDDGILMFENHYLENLINGLQYDMIYHEHQYYYSLHAIINFLNRYEMEVFNLKFMPIHAGSIRLYVQKKGGGRKVEKIVLKTLSKEKENKLINEETFIKFNKRIHKSGDNLIKLLTTIKEKNKSIAGYGASGRGTIIMNFCNLEKGILDYVIDDAPVKQGAYTPGTHLKIVPSNILNAKHRPDYVLLFAWSFLEEIKGKNINYFRSGGKFITPLPYPKII